MANQEKTLITRGLADCKTWTGNHNAKGIPKASPLGSSAQINGPPTANGLTSLTPP